MTEKLAYLRAISNVMSHPDYGGIPYPSIGAGFTMVHPGPRAIIFVEEEGCPPNVVNLYRGAMQGDYTDYLFVLPARTFDVVSAREYMSIVTRDLVEVGQYYDETARSLRPRLYRTAADRDQVSVSLMLYDGRGDLTELPYPE